MIGCSLMMSPPNNHLKPTPQFSLDHFPLAFFIGFRILFPTTSRITRCRRHPPPGVRSPPPPPECLSNSGHVDLLLSPCLSFFCTRACLIIKNLLVFFSCISLLINTLQMGLFRLPPFERLLFVEKIPPPYYFSPPNLASCSILLHTLKYLRFYRVPWLSLRPENVFFVQLRVRQRPASVCCPRIAPTPASGKNLKLFLSQYFCFRFLLGLLGSLFVYRPQLKPYAYSLVKFRPFLFPPNGHFASSLPSA